MTTPPSPTDDLPLRALELEYGSLRQEIMNRTQARQQVLSVAVTLTGAFLGVGWGTGGAVALLLLPIVLMLLAAGWAQNEAQTYQLQAYIRDRLSPYLPGMGWEQHQREQRGRGIPLEVLSIGGIFLIAQIVALVMSVFRFDTRSLVEWVLLLAAGGSVVVLVVILGYVTTKARS